MLLKYWDNIKNYIYILIGNIRFISSTTLLPHQHLHQLKYSFLVFELKCIDMHGI